MEAISYGPGNDPSRRAGPVIDGDAAQHAIAFQAMQAAYAELTGKTESIERSYDKPLLMEAADFRELHHKVAQFFAQYSIVQSNCSFIAVYTDDSRERFTSYERFEFHTSGSSLPIEAVLIEYNYLITQAGLEKPQSYKLSVRAVSKVALLKRMEKELFGLPGIFRKASNRNLFVQIEYVDYVVARSLLGFMDGWADSIRRGPDEKWLRLLQTWSHYFRGLVAAITVSVVFFAAIRWVNGADEKALATQPQALVVLLGTISLAYLAHYFGRLAGTFLESNVDSLDCLSYIHITKADEREIEKAQKQNRKSFVGIGFSLCMAIILNVIANLLASAIIG